MTGELLVTGMVGAGAGIVGAIAGFVAARWLRSIGGERVLISDWRVFYRGRAEGGTPVDVAPSDAEFVQFFFTADFFNTRDEPTGLRDVCVEFHAGGHKRLSITPGDATSLKVGAMHEEITEIDVVNLAPRHWSHWKFRRNVWGDDVAAVVSAEQVYLAMTDPNGKRHRHLIADLPRKALAFAGK